MEKEYFALQKRFHPDQYHNRPEEQEYAMKASARINTAYKTLKNRMSRVVYMLEMNGLDLESCADLANNDLLVEVMEDNDTMSSAKGEEELVPLKDKNDERLERCFAEIERAFKEGDLEKVKSVAVELRYWDNLRNSIDNWPQLVTH